MAKIVLMVRLIWLFLRIRSVCLFVKKCMGGSHVTTTRDSIGQSEVTLGTLKQFQICSLKDPLAPVACLHRHPPPRVHVQTSSLKEALPPYPTFLAPHPQPPRTS